MEDTKHGEWTVITWEDDGTVSAYRLGARWEFRDGELCAEVMASEESDYYGGDCPRDRYLPAAVLLDMMQRAGLIPAENPAAGEA